MISATTYWKRKKFIQLLAGIWKPENQLWKTRVLEVNFKVPANSCMNFFLFQYVVADIIFYSKSPGSAETVNYWPRTSTQCGTPAGISSCPCLDNCIKIGGSCLFSLISASMQPNFSNFFSKKILKVGAHVDKVSVTSALFCLNYSNMKFYTRVKRRVIFREADLSDTVTKFFKFFFKQNCKRWRFE